MSEYEIGCVAVGDLSTNCYVVKKKDTGDACVIDPGDNLTLIQDLLHRMEAKCRLILLTHGHFDHILTLDTLRDATGIPAYIHQADQILLPDGEKNAFALFFGQDRAFRSAEKSVTDGERIPLGQAYVEVIHTPGHTAGSVCYRAGDELLTGDTLFADSFGRYDLYSGDLNTLKGSLRRLAALDPTLTIFPGHGHSVPLGTACDTVCRILHL